MTGFNDLCQIVIVITSSLLRCIGNNESGWTIPNRLFRFNNKRFKRKLKEMSFKKLICKLEFEQLNSREILSSKS